MFLDEHSQHPVLAAEVMTVRRNTLQRGVIRGQREISIYRPQLEVIGESAHARLGLPAGQPRQLFLLARSRSAAVDFYKLVCPQILEDVQLSVRRGVEPLLLDFPKLLFQL